MFVKGGFEKGFSNSFFLKIETMEDGALRVRNLAQKLNNKEGKKDLAAEPASDVSTLKNLSLVACEIPCLVRNV